MRAHLLAALAFAAVGCASTAVAPSRLPAAPTASASEHLALVLSGVPEPMAEEMRVFAPEALERDLAPGVDLHGACGDGASRVLRPRAGRTHFASNAPDRNTLFLYETAIVVGIPVTLASAVFWKFYAETLAEGTLEVYDCASGVVDRRVESFQLRTEGRGFVRTAPLREGQLDGALRGVTRKLLSESLTRTR